MGNSTPVRTAASGYRFVLADDTNLTRWVASGTHEGVLSIAPGMEIEPTDRSMTFEGATVYRMDGENVTEAWWYCDTFGVFVRLGIVPEDVA